MATIAELIKPDPKASAKPRKAKRKSSRQTAGPPINVDRSSRYGRLLSAARNSNHWLKEARDLRVTFCKQLVGDNYEGGGEKSDKRQPINMLGQTVELWSGAIAGNNPRVFCRGPAYFKDVAAVFCQALNDQIEDMKIVGPLNETLREALIAFGVLRLDRKYSDNYTDDYGVEYQRSALDADNCPLGRLVLDVSASKLRQMTFIGDYYYMPLEEARSFDMFSRTGRNELQTATRLGRREKVQDDLGILINNSGGPELDEYVDWVRLLRVFDSTTGKELTFAADSKGDVLMEREYDGPQSSRFGPYHVLSLVDVQEGYLLPLAPATPLLNLHSLINYTARKLDREIYSGKTLIGVTSGADEQKAEQVRSRPHMSVIEMPIGASVQTMRLGGVDPVNWASLLQLKSLYSELAGRPDVLGGIRSDAETATEATLLATNAGRRVEVYNQRFLDFTADVVRAVGHEVWNDPRTFEVTRTVPGTKRRITSYFGPEDRKGSLDDYRLELHPYSMRRRTPGEQLTLIDQIFQKMLALAGAGMLPEGTQVNVGEYLKMAAELSGVEYELDRMLISGPGGPSRAGETSKNPVTRREYVRKGENRSQNSDAQAIQNFMKMGEGQ